MSAHLLWLWRELRLHDHPALAAALQRERPVCASTARGETLERIALGGGRRLRSGRLPRVAVAPLP